MADLNHGIMSLAMIGMAWWPVSAASRWVQTAVFAVFGLAFLAQTVRAGSLTDRGGALAHAAMAGAMTWMVAAMPVLMPPTTPSGGMDMPGMRMAAVTGPASSSVVDPPAWATTLHWMIIGVLVVVTGWWLFRATRSPREQRLHRSCQSLMGAGMGLMLLAMHPGL